MEIRNYIWRRLLTLIPVLFGITFIAFGLGRLAPGDPAEESLMRMGIDVPSVEQIQEMQKELGLDKPLLIQYQQWLKNTLKGDLGVSYLSKRDIKEEMLKRIPTTLKVSTLALVLTITIGIGLGLIMAIYKETILDKILRFVCVGLLSIPGFWLAIILIIVFAEKLRWLPTSGNGGFKYMILPAFVLASSTIGTIARLIRASLIKEMNEQYIITARSKGLTQRLMTLRHAFINSLIPIITLIGNYFGSILGGSAIVETIFSIPGIGSYVLSAINSRDYPIIQGYVLFTGFTYVLVTLAIDIGYIIINPQIRLKGTYK